MHPVGLLVQKKSNNLSFTILDTENWPEVLSQKRLLARHVLAWCKGGHLKDVWHKTSLQWRVWDKNLIYLTGARRTYILGLKFK